MIFCSWIYYFVSFLPRNFRLLCRQTWWWIICKSRKRMVVSASKPAGEVNQFIFARPIEGDWLVVANKPFLEFQWLLNEANCKTCFFFFFFKEPYLYMNFISVASHLASVWNTVRATRKWPVKAFCIIESIWWSLSLTMLQCNLGFDAGIWPPPGSILHYEGYPYFKSFSGKIKDKCIFSSF